VAARQLAAGTFLVDAPERVAAGVAIYARVSSCGLRSDLDRQVAWLARYLTAKDVALYKVGAPGRACPRRGEMGPRRHSGCHSPGIPLRA
jgi:hypothetical protein